ncbi:MAG: hypothetical protein VZR64_00200 [Eubacterium sp.]|nr:hypothetical protein [Eubacterium sp.]
MKKIAVITLNEKGGISLAMDVMHVFRRVFERHNISISSSLAGNIVTVSLIDQCQEVDYQQALEDAQREMSLKCADFLLEMKQPDEDVPLE